MINLFAVPQNIVPRNVNGQEDEYFDIEYKFMIFMTLPFKH